MWVGCTWEADCSQQAEGGVDRSCPVARPAVEKLGMRLGCRAGALAAGGNGDSSKLLLLKSSGPSVLGNSYTERQRLLLGTGLGVE